jgi:replicative DNA helicase
MSRKLHDLDHEIALLNCIYIDRSIIPNVARMVQAADFSDGFNQLVYRKILELDQRGGADHISLNTETGGKNPAFIATLNDHVPTSANWEYYAKSVKRYSMLRNALVLAQNVLSATVETIEAEVDTFLTKGAELMDVSGGAAVKPIREIIPAVIERIEKAYASKGELPGIPTGLDSLDRIIDGYQNDFIILGARPSMGKTALAVGSAASIVRGGKNVGFISAEMPSEKILMRLLSAKTGIDSRSIKAGRLKQAHFTQIHDAFGEIYDYNLWIDDQSTKLAEVVSSCRIMRRIKGCDVIFIDHAGMIVCDGDGVAEKGNNVSKTIKRLQRELGIPIILLSQLKRDAEGKEPNLSDLRNSGSFEEDADVVMFLHRDRITSDGNGGRVDERAPQPAKVIVLKDRDGEIGEAPAMFIPSTARFTDCERT